MVPGAQVLHFIVDDGSKVVVHWGDATMGHSMAPYGHAVNGEVPESKGVTMTEPYTPRSAAEIVTV